MRFRHKELEMAEIQGQEDHHKRDENHAMNPAEVKMVARSFRYMRRKPTIIAYKPPEGNFIFIWTAKPKYYKNIYLTGYKS